MSRDEDLTAIETVRCWSFSSGSLVETVQETCAEEIVRIILNGRVLSTQVATPTQLRELGAGFVVSSGLADSISEVRVEGSTIRVWAPELGRPSVEVTESSGGPSSEARASRVTSDLVIGADEVFTVISQIVSELWERTGGAHCSVLFSDGVIVAKSSDIGRHNTVDKVIGHAILNGIDLKRCVLGCTGRQPTGMVSKAANAGIPIVVSKAATTREGALTAQETGVTLVGRVKKGSFCVYSHPWRIALETGPQEVL
ncbi:MAG: formate dehydrogenase accessory sulfurtransferase FdhD [Desulfomonilia bacterium]|jgi:FdhD protein